MPEIGRSPRCMPLAEKQRAMNAMVDDDGAGRQEMMIQRRMMLTSTGQIGAEDISL